jgi:nitronate monooxygenase
MIETELTRAVDIKAPIICGAMYPCGNLELVAAVSEAGGVGIIQPATLSYVFGLDVRDGIKAIRAITKKPIGFNALVEKTSKAYEARMRQWVDIALEEDIRFFVTSMGNPGWVTTKVHAAGGIVYHDVTEKKWAIKAVDNGVDGLICVNNSAGGHPGTMSPEALYQELVEFNKPLVCAGGVGSAARFKEAIDTGYAGVQIGTRFIASEECSAHEDYKNAIVDAKASDITLTDKISGSPVSVIRTPYIDRVGVKAGWLARKMLKGRITKRWVRMMYYAQSLWKLKRASLKGSGYQSYFQAGKSVDTICDIKPVAEIFRDLTSSIK